MDQRIDKSFKNAPFAVIRHFNAGVGCFLPTCFHIPLYETNPFIKQDNQAAGILCAVERIHHTAAFIKAVPACAEQAGLLDRRIIRKQSACIGQLTIFIPYFKGIKQLFLHTITCPSLISFTQLGKSIVLEIIFGNQCVKGMIHTFKKKLIQYIRWSHHAFVSHTDICFHHAVSLVIIWRGTPCGNRQYKNISAFFPFGSEDKVRIRRDTLFNQTADCFSVRLCVGKPPLHFCYHQYRKTVCRRCRLQRR